MDFLIEWVTGLFIGEPLNSFFLGTLLGIFFHVLIKFLIVWRFPKLAIYIYRFDKLQRQLLDMLLETSNDEHTRETLMNYAKNTNREVARALIDRASK